MNLCIILGTNRKGSYSKRVALEVKQIALSLDIDVNVADPEELDFSYNHNDKNYDKMVEEAEAFVIVTPEYNHSFPGILKTLLDTNYSAYKFKPVFIVGVSSGGFGGTRAIEALIPVLKNFHMYILNKDVNISHVQDQFDNNKNFSNQEKKNNIKDSLETLVKFLR